MCRRYGGAVLAYGLREAAADYAANTPSFAFGMNQRGDVVGQAGYAPFGGAFLLRDGKTIYLPLPEGSSNFISFTAYAVNAEDEGGR